MADKTGGFWSTNWAGDFGNYVTKTLREDTGRRIRCVAETPDYWKWDKAKSA